MMLMVVTAVEFLDSKCMELVEGHLGHVRPIQPANIYTLVETSGSHDHHDREVSEDQLYLSVLLKLYRNWKSL